MHKACIILVAVAASCASVRGQEGVRRNAAITLTLRCKQDAAIAAQHKGACKRAEFAVERMQQHRHFAQPLVKSGDEEAVDWAGWVPMETAVATQMSYEHFFRTHAVARRPLVLTGLPEAATPAVWAAEGLPAVEASCGAAFASGSASVVKDCPAAADELLLSQFIANDLLQRSAPGSPSANASSTAAEAGAPWAGRWPRVLGGSSGAAASDLTFLCPAQLHGLLSVISGAVDVLSFDEHAFASLAPRLEQPLGADVTSGVETADLVAMFGSAAPWHWKFDVDPWTLKEAHLDVKHATIGAGSALFAPAGSMTTWHVPADRSSYVALLHCFADASNYPEVKRALRTEALVDGSAAKLLKHFHAAGFDAAAQRTPQGAMPWASFTKWPRAPRGAQKKAAALDAGKQASRRLQFREWQLNRQWGHLIAHLTLPTPTAPSVLTVARDRVSMRWSTPLQLSDGNAHSLAGYELIWEVRSSCA